MELGISRISEFELVCSDETRLSVEASSTVVSLNNGEQPAMICVARDISRRKKAEETHEATAKRAMLYLDLMSHDITNQLQIMTTSIELIQRLVGNLENNPIVQSLTDSIQKCKNIISKTALLERLVTLPMERKYLCWAVHNVVMDLIEKHDDVVVHANFQLAYIQIEADDFLEQLIASVADNAYRHNPKPEKNIWIKFCEENDGFVVKIADDGPGVPDSKKRTFFEHDHRPSGLGLQLCRTIIGKYGGTMSVHDRVPGDSTQGAEIHLWFPFISKI